MKGGWFMRKTWFIPVLAVLMLTVVGCSRPLTQREEGGLIGGFIGAGSGAIIGSTVGHAAAGAAIGGPIGLIAGALIGDQMMSQANYTQRTDSNQSELERLRRENRRLRDQRAEW
jgi:osmotically inducible lipoprotein OsmB